MDATNPSRDRPKRASCVKMRLLIAILATLCPVVCYIGRQNLPLAIVSMVEEEQEPGVAEKLDTVLNPTPLPDSVLGDDLGLLHSLEGGDNQAFKLDVSSRREAAARSSSNATTTKQQQQNYHEEAGVCPQPSFTDATTGKTTQATRATTYGPKYAWSQDQRGRLLGAFFYTYVIFQIPGARLAEIVGAKWILAAASSGTAALSFVSPWAAARHVYLLWAVRFLMGVFQAAIYPSCYVLYSRWLPPTERSQALPILGVGAFVGSIVASGLTGYASEQPALGWEWAFYVPGILCALWSIAWIWFASDEPSQHKFISIEEIQHIESKLERSSGGGSGGGVKRDISWRKLASSRAIWIMMAAFFASNWSFTIVLLLVPSYLNSILQVSPLENGMINSIIYILFCVVSPLVGTISTMMVETRACGLSRLAIRRVFQCTALYGQVACFLAITWIGCDRMLVFAVLFTQIVFFSLVNGGEVQLPAELSPDFSGTIYAIGNCVGSSTGFIVPEIYSLIVADPRNRALWHYFFYLAAGVSATGATVFLLFGQNKMQDFAKDLGESQLDFGRLGLTGDGAGGTLGPKGSSFKLVESHHYQQRSPNPARSTAAAALPPLKGTTVSTQQDGVNGPKTGHQ